MRIFSQTSGITLNAPTLERKRNSLRKYLKRLYSKISRIWERKMSPKSRKLRVPYRINPRRNTPRHLLIKLTRTTYKEKKKKLKAATEKQQITYKGIPIRLLADFSMETLQAIREWKDTFKLMKMKKLPPILFYPARISFKFNAEIKK